MASFSAPYLFGGGTRVLTVQIFNAKVNGDVALAYTQSIVLISVSILMLVLLRYFESRRLYATVSKGAPAARRRIGNRRLERLLGAAAILVVVFLLLPHLTILLVSFVREGSWTTQILPPEYTTENYRRLFADPQFFEPIRNSLSMSLLATLGNLIFGFLAAYLLASRRAFLGRRLLEGIILLPWALPGTVMAIALASTFSVNSPWQGRVLLVGSFWILPLAYFVRNVPLMVRAIQSSFAQADPSIEEAAYTLGAGAVLTLRRVVAPMVLPGIITGSLMALVMALGEFVASIVLYTPFNRPISVEILAQLRQFSFGTAAAYGVVLSVLIAGVFVVIQLWRGRSDQFSF